MQLNLVATTQGFSRPRHIGVSIYRGCLVLAVIFWMASTIYVLWPHWPEHVQGTVSALSPLAAEPSSLDFGVVWNSGSFHWKLPIRNTSDATIDVKRVGGSCSCTSVSPSAFVLKPGERVELAITYDLASRTRDAEGTTALFENGIVAYGPGSVPIASWTVRGLVKQGISCVPRELTFGDSLICGQPYSPRTLEVTCVEPCRSFAAIIDPRYGAAFVTNASDDHRHFQVKVAPSASLGLGMHKFDVALSATLQSGERLPAVPVPIQARVVGDLRILPDVTHFGDVTLGEAREQTVSVSSRTGQPFDVANYVCSSKDVTVSPIPSKGAEGQAYRIKIRPSRVGLQESDVHFTIKYRRPGEGVAKEPMETGFFIARYFGVK
jgi:hypothetical protein